MSRHRPPQVYSSPYITADGYKTLQAELNTLWDKRAEVTKAVTVAAAEGDRSENAEYIYRKKELREIDRRLRYLQKRLPELKIVPEQQHGNKKIFSVHGLQLNVSLTKQPQAMKLLIVLLGLMNLIPTKDTLVSTRHWEKDC